MRAPKKRWAMLLAATGALSLAGCDSASNQADKEARKNIDEGIQERSIDTPPHQAAATKAFEAAAKSSDASAVSRTHANALLAEQRADSAMELTRQIDRHELQLARVAFELEQLAVQLETGNVLVTDYSKYDPKPARDQIVARIAEAQGGPDKANWFEHEKSTVPTLAAVKQKISQLEGGIAKLQDQAKSLGDQRTALLGESEAASQSSEASTGEKAVSEFKRFSELRRKAGELFIQIEQLNAQMIPLQSDLAVAQGQQDVLNGVIGQWQKQLEALDTGWTSITKQIEAQRSLARQIVGSESSAPPTTGPSKSDTIAAKAGEISRLAQEIRTLRQGAQENLDDAAKYFKDANAAANELSQELSKRINEPANQNRPERSAWENLKKVMDPQDYRLREAAVQRMKGALFASEAASLNNRINLQASAGAAIERAGASIPTELRPGDLGKNFKDALKQAKDAYEGADELLAQVIDGVTQKETKDAALVERVIACYGMSQVAKLNGEPTTAAEQLKKAIATRDEAAGQNIRLPALPAELGSPPAPVAPPNPETPAEPGTTPTTAPATPSGETPTPAPSGETPTTAPSGETPTPAPSGETPTTAPSGETPATNPAEPAPTPTPETPAAPSTPAPAPGADTPPAPQPGPNNVP